MKLSEELVWRNLIKDRTFNDLAWLDEPKTFYLGVDCVSAPSMTIGNLAVFLVARRLMEYGWRPVLLVGGATSLVGDPGGKTEERDLKSRDEVAQNVESIKSQVNRLFSGKQFELVDNYDWLKDLSYLDFLREVGKHYSMTELLQRDYIASRIGEGGSGISYAEFSYSLLQGYDFWYLYKNKQVALQIGGSDQWGNMLSGVPLIRKKEDGEAHAFSVPLMIDKTTGKKFGKSEAGAIWLDESMTSVFRFYQFWLNADDAGAIDYLKVYTMLQPEEIMDIQQEFSQNPGNRLAQKKLADAVTEIVHGKDKAAAVKKATETLFGNLSFGNLGDSEYELLRQELPLVAVNSQNLQQLLVAGQLAGSTSEANRLITGGAVAVNGQRVMDSKAILPLKQGSNIVKCGKNRFMIAEVK